jgi:hypothetical protein
MEGSLVAYKVFSNGSVLNASEINDNLMNQSVMVFSNSAARTAAITSPLEGMLTYLEDVDRYEHWNGSAWISPFGMTLLATASPSATSSQSINNVFSSQYQNYALYYNLTGTASAELRMRLRVSGTDATTGYAWQALSGSGSTVSAVRDTSSQIFTIGALRTSGRAFGVVDISNPFATAETSYFTRNQDPLSAAVVAIYSGSNTNSTSYDGVNIYPGSGTMTGTIRIYGVRN